MPKARTLFQSSVAVFLVVIILLAFHWLGWLRPVETAVSFVFQPIVRGMRVVSTRIGNAVSIIGNIGELAEENRKLVLELEQSKSQVAQLSEVQAEVEDLRARLSADLPSEVKTIMAGVIGHDGISATKRLVINKGDSDGIKEGSAVLSAGGSFIGRIEKVSAIQSEIMLITDDRSVVPARIGESRATGLLKGELGLGLKMTDIPQQDAVKVGDLVVTSGLSGQLPKGLVIGSIEAIEDQANALFQVARLRPLVNVTSLEFVHVVTDF